MDQLLTVLKDLDLNQWGGLALLGAVAWFGRGYLATALSWAKGMLPAAFTTTAPASDRMAALTALDEAFKYFQAVGCQEGMAGIRALVPHVYQDHPAEPHA